MNDLATALAPAFVAGFALQQLIELLDPVLDQFLKPHKKWILSVVTIVLSLLLALLLELRILRTLGIVGLPWLDTILTAFFIAGNTKGINDLLKLIGYKKEEAKVALKESQVARA
ncbi:MAG: hypothetical protein GTO14_12125 [Anaerolineales bacterium]|nr:hypothetical protein [Anaerolineales bacterium]